MGLQLNNYQIKLLAAILMVIDHIGVVLLPKVVLLRMIGRLSFPLFAWLLTQGERHTRNFQRYCSRLFFFGLVSQPFYLLALEGVRPNILFTLTLGLLCLRWSHQQGRWRWLIWIGGIGTAELLQFEYGAYGIAAIALLAEFRLSLLWWLAWSGLHLLMISIFGGYGLAQFPAIVTPLLLLLANQERGPTIRWFYSFYPLHLLILFLLDWFLIMKGDR